MQILKNSFVHLDFKPLGCISGKHHLIGVKIGATRYMGGWQW